jgi:hypothetical protein
MTEVSSNDELYLEATEEYAYSFLCSLLTHFFLHTFTIFTCEQDQFSTVMAWLFEHSLIEWLTSKCIIATRVLGSFLTAARNLLAKLGTTPAAE